MKEGCWLDRLSSSSKISVDPGPEGVFIGFELRILLRARSEPTSHSTPTQYPELNVVPQSSQGQAVQKYKSDPCYWVRAQYQDFSLTLSRK